MTRALSTTMERDDSVEQVRDATDLVALVSESVRLRRSGANMVGLCPFHQEKTPSFTVSPARQVFHCFGCGAGGDAFKYVMLAEGLTFPDALARLADRAGIALQTGGGRRGERAKLLQVLERATALYEKCLAHPTLGERARTYLARRGIQPETIVRFRIGYAPERWDTLVSRAPEEMDRLVTLGLAARGERGPYDRFRDRVVFPVMDAAGRVIGHGARLLAEGGTGGPKYVNSPETPLYRKSRVLYGPPMTLAPIREAGEAIVVEGYTDLLSLYQAGARNAVAACGTAFTELHAEALGRLARRAVLVYDGDAAGRGASLKTAALLASRGTAVRVAALPDGADPDSFARERGTDAVARLVAEAQDPLSWLASRPEGRRGERGGASERIEAVVGFLALVDDDLRRRALAQDAAELVRVPADVLVAGVERARREQGRTTGRAQGAGGEQGPGSSRVQAAGTAARAAARPAAEEPLAKRKDRALALALAHAAAAETFRTELSPDDFTSPERRRIAEAIADGATLDAAGPAAARLAVEGGEVDAEHAVGELRAHALAIRRERLAREMKDLATEVERRRKDGGESAETRALEDRQKRLNEELRDLSNP